MSDSDPLFHVLIPCAGTGSRMGLDTPKQYMPLAGLPLVIHTLRAFGHMPQMGQGVIVVSPDDGFMADVIKRHPQSKFKVFPTGGALRANTVLSGLVALKSLGATGNDWVMVHDAARCLITPSLIQQLFDQCQHDEVGGLLAVPLADTLKSGSDGRVTATVKRSDKWLAQTPQMFRLDNLFHALTDAVQAVTDESSAIELLGQAPQLVPGASFNFKVTFPEDVTLAEAILAERQTKEFQTHGPH
jgi:2-C-methyl-D-erythritol 4-phosphate cytidylyltransferase